MAELATLWNRCVNAYLSTMGRNTPSTMDDAGYRRMVAAIEYQRDHFADTPAVIIPCYQNIMPKASVAGLRAMHASLGTKATLRLAADKRSG